MASFQAPRWFQAGNLDSLLGPLYESLLGHGDIVTTSRGPSVELRGVQLELTDPRARLSRSWLRGRLFSALGEFVWYAAGSTSLNFIESYIPGYGEHVGGGEQLEGAYGPRLFGPLGQIEPLIETLASKPATRKAVIQIFDRTDLDNHSFDVPCTCTLQFFIRDQQLEMHVHMRSNDAFIGLPHDIFSFTMIQEYVAARLSLIPGTYVHSVASMHLYEAALPKVRQYLAEGHFAHESMPPMPQEKASTNLEWLVETEQHSRLEDGRPLSLPDGYWGDLAHLLRLQQMSVRDGDSFIPPQRSTLDPYFATYVTDQHLRQARKELG